MLRVTSQNGGSFAEQKIIKNEHCFRLENKIHGNKIHLLGYRRIPIITAPVIFGFSSPKGPLLSGGRYFRVAVTFGWLENVCNSAVVLHKEDT